MYSYSVSKLVIRVKLFLKQLSLGFNFDKFYEL